MSTYVVSHELIITNINTKERNTPKYICVYILSKRIQNLLCCSSSTGKVGSLLTRPNSDSLVSHPKMPSPHTRFFLTTVLPSSIHNITVLHAREFRSTRNLENWALEQSLPAIDSLKNKKKKPSNQGDHKIKSWLRFITISFPSNNLGKRDLHLNDPRTTNERSERAQRSTD